MITFIYLSSYCDKNRESVSNNVFRAVSSYINLPAKIELEFGELGESIYGETLLDVRYKNRIRLHQNLTCKEIIVPFIHELLHLNQIFTGKLAGCRDGSFLWNNKVYQPVKVLSIFEWSRLPWEVDVAEKEQDLLYKVLKL